jgi:hypothetical protein
MSTKDMLSCGDIVEDNTGKNPVEYAEKHKLQYPLDTQGCGSFS